MGLTNADFDSSSSTSGYVFCLEGSAISWRTKLQGQVALSATEAEYVVVSEAVKEKLWPEDMLEELGFSQRNSVLYCYRVPFTWPGIRNSIEDQSTSETCFIS